MDKEMSVIELSREEIMQQCYELGYAYEQRVSVCSQCTLAALAQAFHTENDELFKAAFAFAGGGGETAIGFCGALAGGILFISSFLGRSRTEFDLAIDNYQAFAPCEKLITLFEEEWGVTSCYGVREKLFGRPVDTRKKEDLEYFLAMGGHSEKCPEVVGRGAALAAGIMWDELQKKATR